MFGVNGFNVKVVDQEEKQYQPGDYEYERQQKKLGDRGLVIDIHNNPKAVKIYETIMIVIGSIITLIFGTLFILTYSSYNKYTTKYNTYTAVVGTIVGYQDVFDDTKVYDKSSLNKDNSYATLVKYAVGSNTYEAATTSFDDGDEITSEIGATSNLKYNPSNPKDVVFEVDKPDTSILYYLLLPATLFGLFMIIISISKLNNAKNKLVEKETIDDKRTSVNNVNVAASNVSSNQPVETKVEELQQAIDNTSQSTEQEDHNLENLYK